MKQIKWIVGILMLTMVWIGIAPTFYRLMTNDACDLWLERIYYLFNNNYWLNIPICLSMIYLCAILCKRFFSLKEIPYHWFFVIAFCVFVLYYQSPFEYAKIVWIVDYRFFFLFFLGVLGLVLFASVLFMERKILFFLLRGGLWRKISRISRINNAKKRGGFVWNMGGTQGFSLDNNKNIKHSESVLGYADTIVNILWGTKISEESFAIGITSEWGAGKTTFLKLIRRMFEKRLHADIVVFNPWMCQSPEQVTRDFFSSLRHQLSKRHSELSNPIKKYAKHLNAISIPVSRFVSIEMTNLTSGKSLHEMKMDLSEKFSKLRHPVVVIIDDLDRLESSEVFEVLRLIRNTADLKNIIYLVAYDKDYITSILSDKHISDPSAYLEKIFQLEIQLPLVTYKQVWDTLLDELHAQIPEFDISFIYHHEELIVKILNTYRRAKRFARLFLVSYHYLSGNHSIHELEWSDVFLLDLLQMDDKEIYDILSDKPEEILEPINEYWVYDKSKHGKILLKDDGKALLNDGTRIKPTTDELLICLWGEKDKNTHGPNSICRIECFEEYFTLQVQFSRKDIEQLKNSEDIDSMIKDWHNKGKSLSILADKMKDIDQSDLTEPQKKNIIWGTLSICYYDYGYYYNYTCDYLSNNDNLIDDWFGIKMKNECDFPRLLHMVKYLSQCQIEENKLNEIINRIVHLFIEKKKCSVLQILDDESPLYDFICDFDEIRNYAFDCMVKIFSEKKIKPTQEECDKMQKQYIDNQKKNTLKLLFGEEWLRYWTEILQKCIEPIKK